MESYPNSLAWYSNPNLSFKTHLPPLLYLSVLGKLNHSLLPGACVLPIPQALSGPFTWDAFSPSLEILPTLQDPDQMVPPPPSHTPRPSLRKSLWYLALLFAGAYLWTPASCSELPAFGWMMYLSSKMAYSLKNGGRWREYLILVLFPIISVYTS